ncbi:Sec-independent protein translocase subunit TatA [Lentzea sp. HUAS12]|uniref:Sec-independent protein translocase subunit TatA n=1 Tax=Lentzea sp. HUAS12 TaxID=2951806 RepID=UPI00209DBF60|nr:Sec-independent protein translocase subunit TatA [Lentzea sp. HUAS12]USX54638.1 Sec-independent protein translocase subunit TatA [Lentzea sp. HUAS12]
MSNLGATELLIIAAVILLLFGSKKLPEMARSLGRSAKILKAETSGSRDDEAPAAPTADDARVARLQQQVDDLQQQLRAAQQTPKTHP